MINKEMGGLNSGMIHLGHVSSIHAVSMGNPQIGKITIVDPMKMKQVLSS